ncbi:hypothetical protein IQ07DRAFT_524947 [Pyrenochaeta sp. DS3sAY3a]|nr:hypothetical protein IQ07DRAFT_524947 [Pyrenochaeta sp. DS3sAY3a]
MASTKSGHHDLDFPEIIGHSYASNNPTIAPLPVIFLFKLASPARSDIIHKIEQGDGTPWPENVPKKSIGVIPWLRSFTPTIDDVVDIAAGSCIILDEDLFHDGKCLVSHNFFKPNHTLDTDPREYGIVDLTQAYRLACTSSSDTSFFPGALPPSQKFLPLARPNPTPKPRPSPPHPLTGDLPVFITAPLSPLQEAYILALLTCESGTPDLIHLPNPAPHETDDMDHLMAHFLAHAWFPGDFAVVDARTVSSIPFEGPFPDFGVATELLIWHRAGDEQLVGRDNVGYVYGRRVVEDSEEFGGWCGNVSRGMGLGKGDERDGEELERYYWGCWLDGRGRVEGEVRAEAVVKY